MNTDGSVKNIWIPTLDQITGIPCYEYVVDGANIVLVLFKNDEPRGFLVVNSNLPGSDVVITFTDYHTFTVNWIIILSDICPVPSLDDFNLFIRRL